jgi:23S rRNA (pseudouridine1915-N3)-methyltransferase|tara:strand:- start:2760 stop:3230 length:471 start_codon:yes stop_codon:yes gene_type:complete
MKIKLLVVGKTSGSFLVPLISDYVKRINRFVNFEIIEINNIKLKKVNSLEIQKREGVKILDKIDKIDQVFILDEKGKSYNSIDFSKFIENKIVNSSKNIIFIIGGAYGFSEKIYSRSNSIISLSKMTFSHQIIRLFMVEQLYRALTIINNHPYHNE